MLLVVSDHQVDTLMQRVDSDAEGVTRRMPLRAVAGMLSSVLGW